MFLSLVCLCRVFTISPTSYGIPIPSDYFKSIIYALEILRRQQWNFYRLENEHLTNCEQYRVVNIVPLPMSVSDADVGAHTAPEAAVLIRQDSRNKELQEEQQQQEEERKEMESAHVDEQQHVQDGEQPMMRVSRRDSPPRTSILRHFSLGRADDDSSPDSSPDSRSEAPHTGTATSPRSVARAASSSAVLLPSSTTPSRPLLAAANMVQMASAGVPELEDAMRAAMRVTDNELAKMRASPPSAMAGMRDTLEKEMSQYGLQGRRNSLASNPSSPEVSRNEQQQPGKSPKVSPSKRTSPSSSALNSSPDASSGEEDEQQRTARATGGVGRRGSGSGGGGGSGSGSPRGRGVGAARPLYGRSASPPPIDTSLNLSAASVLSVPSWLSATPLLQSGPSFSPPSAEMKAAQEGRETSTARTPRLSRHNSSEREKKQ